MKNYHKYTKKDGVITDGGTQWLSDTDIANWSKDTALVEIGSEPDNWQDMNVMDGQLVRASDEVIAQRQAAATASQSEVEIAELHAYLTSTDYTAIKCGELGQSMAEAYPEVYAKRNAARARINELEKTTKL